MEAFQEQNKTVKGNIFFAAPSMNPLTTKHTRIYINGRLATYDEGTGFQQDN